MTDEKQGGFYTIRVKGKSEIKIMGSVFHGIAAGISSTAEAELLSDRIKEEFPNAAHYPSACRFFEDGVLFERQSDDGEPSGTAGKPALLTLQGAGLHNAGIVIARYFGGKKLGTGRLFHAFADCAALAVENSEKEYHILTTVRYFSYPYHMTNAVNKAVADCEANIISSKYSDMVDVSVEIPVSRELDFIHIISDYSGGKIILE